MNLLKCYLIKNDCYKSGRTIKPKGVMVHSTGANNPTLKRYVQPASGQEGYDELMEALGKNKNANSWNRPGIEKCVHAFIGRLADKSVAAVQTLPWEARGWHAGSGKSGSANNTHISFEICEDDLKDPEYFADVYREAVELTAYLCGEYGLDPLADGVVIDHAEGYRRGIASGHADVGHWFPKFDKTMDDFRRDVRAEMDRGAEKPNEPDVSPGDGTEKGDKEMTGEEIFNKLNEYLKAQTVPEWAQKELKEAMDMGITDGSTPTELIPVYQAAIMALRAAKQAINATK